MTATDYAAAAAPGGELALLLAAIALCAAYLVHAWATPPRRPRPPERTPTSETPTARHDDRPATDSHPRPRGADRPPFDQERQ